MTSRPLRAARGALASVLAAASAHRVFTVLLVAGLALRVVTFLAYRPALLFYDSARYLQVMQDIAPGQVRPTGYPIFLRLLPTERLPEIVPAVQHLFGLAIAVLLYALLVRLGVRLWLAALATAPVLLDGYQLAIEQYVLVESLLEMLLITGCVLVLWWRRPPAPALVLAGLAFATAGLVRSNALLAIGPAVVALVFLRPGLARVAAFAAAVALPLAGYAAWFESEHGRYALNGFGGRFLYARVAPFAECNRFEVPAEERVLCPTQPLDERPTIAQFMWNNRLSPVYRIRANEGRTRRAGSFARRVIRNQPLDYAEVVLRDFVYGFSPTKTQRAEDPPLEPWRFPTGYRIYVLDHTRKFVRAAGYEDGSVNEPLAKFLHHWQRFVFTPGPLLALAIALGLAAAAGLGRARRSGLRTAAFLFTFAGLAIYVGAVAVAAFSWRYQLPLLVLLPPAGALGLTALTHQTGRRAARDQH